MRVAHHQTTPYHRPICLQNCDAIKQLLKLQLQAAAGLDVESIGYWSGPPAWIASARAAAKPCLMNWENGKAELADLLCGSSSTLMSPLAYCNGAFFKCQISYVEVEGGTVVAISVRYEISEVARVAPCSNAAMMTDKRVVVVNARLKVLREDGSWSAPRELGDKECTAASPDGMWSQGFSVPEGCATVSGALLALAHFIHRGCLSIRVELNAK